MSTLQSPITYARVQAQTDSNGLTDANAIIFANEAQADFTRRLVTDAVDAAQVEEVYRDLTAGVGTYLYPSSPQFMLLKAIELNYTDSNLGNFMTATQVDVANIAGQSSFSWLRLNCPTLSPQFDDRGDWYEVFPTPTVTIANGIRLFGFIQPVEYSATTDTLSYPFTLDYRIFGWRIAADYYYSLNKFDEGDKFNLKYEERVKNYIASLGRGSQQPLQSQVLNVGNNGWQF